MKKLAWIIVILFLLAGCGAGGGMSSGAGGGMSSGTGDSAGGGKKKPPAPPSSDKGNWIRVSRVVDGDTFEIMNKGVKEKVRLIGVDTPESVKPGSPVEPFGIEASNFTKKLIEGKMVRLEFDVQERDKYGRLLAYVYLEDGTLLNAKLLEEGLATVMTVPPNVRMADNFIKIQRKAREEKKGIWK